MQQRWSREKAQAWYDALPWMVGCNFIPSNAVNQLEMWQSDTFDPVTIDRELGWAAALGMNPAMWLLMMDHIPMMPTEESILWFGTMFVTAFAAFLIAWPFNYWMVRVQRKSGLM